MYYINRDNYVLRLTYLLTHLLSYLLLLCHYPLTPNVNPDLSLPVQHRPQTTCLHPAVLCCRLHLPPAVLETRCPLSFLQIPLPGVLWSSSAAVSSPLQCLFGNINLINESGVHFNFQLPSELLIKRKDKFIEKFISNQSLLDYFAFQ